MKCCFNWKVIAGLGVAALAVWAVAPNLVGNALPALAALICPVSMIVMVIGMRGSSSNKPAAAEMELSQPACEESRSDRLLRLQRERLQIQAEMNQVSAELRRRKELVSPSS